MEVDVVNLALVGIGLGFCQERVHGAHVVFHDVVNDQVVDGLVDVGGMIMMIGGDTRLLRLCSGLLNDVLACLGGNLLFNDGARGSLREIEM